MNPLRLLFFLIIAFFSLATSAQPWLDDAEAWLEWTAASDDLGDDGAAPSAEALFELLATLSQHPLSINAGDGTLSQLPFLTPRQVEDVDAFVYRHGPLHQPGELLLIPSLDLFTRRLLLHFVTFDDPSAPLAPSTADAVRHTLLTRLDVPLYQRAGYQPFTAAEVTAAPGQHYWGNALYHSLRYDGSRGPDLAWGLSAEKDAGEPFLVRGLNGTLMGAQGYDHYAGFVRFRHTIVGDYRLSFGQGLVVSNQFSVGKNAVTPTRSVTAPAARGYCGTAEDGFMQGAVTTVGWGSARSAGRYELTAFASCRPVDATLVDDSIRTLLTTGYHRTLTEYQRRHNATSFVGGTHLSWHGDHGLHLGLTATTHVYSLPLVAGDGYRAYNPAGRTFFHAAADYALYRPRFSLVGETAVSGNGGVATLTTLTAEPLDRVTVSTTARHYSPHYQSLSSSAVSEGSTLHGEDGITLATTVTALTAWRFTAYADLFRFTTPRYRISQPSRGADLSASAQWMPHDRLTLLARYRCKVKERDVLSDYRDLFLALYGPDALQRVVTQRVQLQTTATLDHGWSLRAHADYCRVDAEAIHRGGILSLRATCDRRHTHHREALGASRPRYPYVTVGPRLTAEAAWFRTTSYDARLYAYEPSLLYAYGLHAYYGHGLRALLLADWSFRLPLTLTAKVSTTAYLDRKTIGTGPAQIPQSHAEDLAIQLRWKF